MHDEEPLAEWARRREERRNRSMGRLRAVPLTEGPHRAAHVEPDAPRVIEEWDGSRWAAVGLVDDLAAAKSLLLTAQLVEEKPAGWDGSGSEGRGRHRKPDPADEQNR